MKKILAFMLVLLMSVSVLAACGDDKNTSSAAGDTSSTVSETSDTASDATSDVASDVVSDEASA